MLSVDLLTDVASPVTTAALVRHLQPTLEQNHHGDAIVEILLTNDERMRELNCTHRGQDTTTDVLSLPTAIDSERGSVMPQTDRPTILGTIVISLDEAKRKVAAGESTHHSTHSTRRVETGEWNDLQEELLGLAEHGLRHLLGHTHDDEGNWLAR